MIYSAQLTPAPRVKNHHGSESQIILSALHRGAVPQSANSVKWDVAGRCERPVFRTIESRPSSPERNYYCESKWGYSIFMDIWAKCRKCATCLRQRAAHWRLRIASEMANMSRGWFGTLTLRPEEHYRAMCQAAVELRSRGVEFSDLAPEQQFLERHRIISKWLTLWLKRVRKNSGAPLRYCLVAEAHKSGLPHYHIIVQEVDPVRPVRKVVLTDAWPHGFTQFKLIVDDLKRVTNYVAKYLSKSQLARVRASLGYGEYRLSASEDSSSRETRHHTPSMEHRKVWTDHGNVADEISVEPEGGRLSEPQADGSAAYTRACERQLAHWAQTPNARKRQLSSVTFWEQAESADVSSRGPPPGAIPSYWLHGRLVYERVGSTLDLGRDAELDCRQRINCDR